MRNAVQVVVASFLLVVPAQASAAPTFTEIAREFGDGLMWLDEEVRPSIGDDGTVLFVGSNDFRDYHRDVLFWGDGTALDSLDLAAHAVSNVNYVRINNSGTIVLVGDRAAAETHRGVYGTSTADRTFSTLYEAVYDPSTWPSAYVTSNVALTNSGMVAFATIRNAAGTIYRGPFAGPLESLRTGSGVFFNVRDLDLNEAGQVAVQMEYTDPTAGLSRGILIFDEPEPSLTEIDTAIERLDVSTQPKPAINAAGQVAFALNGRVTLLFFDPPGVYSDPPAVTITLQPGVYVSSPTPFSEPNEVTMIAGITGPYASFGRVDINDAGLVVFEANLDDGGSGIYTGSNPALHKVIATGDIRDGQLFSWVLMGELNNAGQLAVLTSDYYSTDRQVWRIDNLPPRGRIHPGPRPPRSWPRRPSPWPRSPPTLRDLDR